MKNISISFAVLVCFMFSFSSNFCFEINKSYAVKPLTYEQRKAIKKREKERKGEIFYNANKKDNKECPYGVDKVTGKCYEPKEGQLYRNPKTGKMEMKEMNKVNLPWNKDSLDEK